MDEGPLTRATDKPARIAPVTLRQVAESSGVHTSTASRVLNGDPTLNVPENTRKRIQVTAQRLGYRANVVARGLRLRQTFALGLLIPDISDPIFAMMFKGAEASAEKHDYHLILSNTADDSGLQDRRIEMMRARNVDGFILATALRSDPAIKKLDEQGIPYVLLNRRTEDGSQPHVVSDDGQGAFAATMHLIRQGHRRIAHLAGPQATTTAYQRLQGYKRALKESGIAFDPSLVKSTHFREEAGEMGMAALLEADGSPTGIFAVNDLTAIGAITVIRERGLSVPEDIAVVGYNDIPLADKFKPSLTSVRTPLEEMGQAAAEMLIALLTNQDRPRGVIFQPELVVRDSSSRS